MTAAAIILNYMRDDLTYSVVEQLTDAVPTVIYDDCSPRPYLRRLHDPMVICGSEHLGYVGAANCAMQIAVDTGKWDAVWLLNNDLAGLSPALLAKLVAALESSEQLAAVSPAVVPNAHPQMRPSGMALRLESYVDFVCPLVRLSAWGKVGGFDPQLKGYGCDIQFAVEARRLGYTFAVLGNQVVQHAMGSTMKTTHCLPGQDDLQAALEYLKAKYQVSNVWELRDGKA